VDRPEYRPVDLERLRTYSVRQRSHKVDAQRSAQLPAVGASAVQLLDSLPDYLGASALRKVVDAVVAAVRAKRPVVLAMGAHVVKVGCSPIIIDLLERGIVRAIAMNGATAIHDLELAMLGATSEEVADTIRDGSFGMVEETLDFFADASRLMGERSAGLGATLGAMVLERKAPNAQLSILAAAARVGAPATVHVALGTDTVHVGPKFDAGAFGAASMRDFRLLCSVVSDLGASAGGSVGGVWLNIGSAVVLPEVFLKAVAVARNLGANLDALTTANFDMLGHYRPRMNVVLRPVAAGRGHEVIGHHEILLPLLRQAVIERLAAPGAGAF
jgi:hypothetical protein